jgi:inosose dehydratase
MDAVDTKHVKFAPDVGQLQKGGADAAKVIKDYLPLVEHMHLKDFVGAKPWGGYCSLVWESGYSRDSGHAGRRRQQIGCHD